MFLLSPLNCYILRIPNIHVNVKTIVTDKYIREKMIREYISQCSRTCNKGRDVLDERDDRHRELNEEFAFMDADGTFGIGCKSHTNLKYKNTYTWIEDKIISTFYLNILIN